MQLGGCCWDCFRGLIHLVPPQSQEGTLGDIICNSGSREAASGSDRPCNENCRVSDFWLNSHLNLASSSKHMLHLCVTVRPGAQSPYKNNLLE